MSIGIGVIGAGVMGGDHARSIATSVGGAHLAAISDADAARAAHIAAETGARRHFTDGMALIADNSVDAVLVASPDHTHADFVLACLRAGKPVLCEKPLAANAAECHTIIAAEVAAGRRLVQVGFMRRFDPAYAAMRAKLESGALGAAVMLHCLHHNASAPPWFDAEMVITNAAVHEIDIARFLLDAEIAAATVFVPGGTQSATRDRLLLVFEMMSGAVVDVGVFVNAGYGYDVRAELVCERGSIARDPREAVVLRHDGREALDVAPDWRAHFAAAYRLQLQGWVKAIRDGVPVGASAWDGFAATATADACVQALRTGERVRIALPARPDFYD
ncbi:MAG TPA: Gfo/Idh/MocA family oxidoreductase [Acetobacteraceae bacterium]|nr:Gfo/Idh/MocA family oxidoreductase [Acetobacteraceae bacterium]